MSNFVEILTKSKAIGEGFARVVLNLRTSRMVYIEENFCKKCPLSHRDGRYTGVCDKKAGGCGCVVKAKTSQSTEPCPKGFWANSWAKPELLNEFLKEYGK